MKKSNKSTYSEKLLDPRWQKKRTEVLLRDNYTCLNCGAKDKTLHVHHLEYNEDPWDTDVDKLETLCAECNENREAINKRIKKLVTSIPTKWMYRGKFDPIINMVEAVERLSFGINPENNQEDTEIALDAKNISCSFALKDISAMLMDNLSYRDECLEFRAQIEMEKK